MPTLDATTSVGLTSERGKGSRATGASGRRQQGRSAGTATASETEEGAGGSLAAALAGVAGRLGVVGGPLPIAGTEMFEVEGADFEANAEEELLAL
jgi:hypothetical protein